VAFSSVALEACVYAVLAYLRGKEKTKRGLLLYLSLWVRFAASHFISASL
jgi:hypothetical protein